jgi:hypothetical protein
MMQRMRRALLADAMQGKQLELFSAETASASVARSAVSPAPTLELRQHIVCHHGELKLCRAGPHHPDWHQRHSADTPSFVRATKVANPLQIWI